MEEETYVCASCGAQQKVEKGQPIPVCCACNKEMEPLPYCTNPPHAEMSRFEDKDEPCADGTTPKRYKK